MDLNNLQYGQSNDILQFIISNGIIDINDVRNCMEDMKKEELLKQHPYEIWQSKDGKWYTYLPAQGGGRVLKKRKSKKDLERIIIDYYKNKKEILLRDIFKEWSSQKLEYGEIQKQTFDRYTTDFHRFFDGSYIAGFSTLVIE